MTLTFIEQPDLPSYTLSSNEPPSNYPLRSVEMNSELVGAIVASVFEISKEQLFSPQRGKASVAFARQIAMYLTHITCGYSYTDIGSFFGRDRTTVSYACQLVEERREDPKIDWSLDLMEHSILSLKNGFQG